MGPIFGLIGTVLMILFHLWMFGYFDGIDYDRTLSRKDLFIKICYFGGMACTWWSIPGAWFRSLPFDPTLVIMAIMFYFFMTFAGVIKAEKD